MGGRDGLLRLFEIDGFAVGRRGGSRRWRRRLRARLARQHEHRTDRQ
jgi:hypothetical protein